MKLENEMMELHINEIRPNPKQSRTYFDKGKLQILADSIKEIGVNTPIQLIWDCDNGKKATIKDGERRFRALKLAGFTKLQYGKEYIIVDTDKDELGFRGLIANCMQENLQPIEKGLALMELLKRRGVTKIELAINVINRAKDYIDNNFIAEPSSRNFYISREIVKQIAKDMKTIGVSGTNAVDLLKLLKLPKDIQQKIIFSSPNIKIKKEKTKINRFGDIIPRTGNDGGKIVPMSFARELARLENDKICRFFLRKSFEKRWTSSKLNNMVTDYLSSHMTPEKYIEAYSVCPQGVCATQKRMDELDNFTKTIDNFTSTLTSFRIINLVAMADRFKQKTFLISGVGLRNTTIKLKNALDDVLLTGKQLAKLEEQEREEVLKLPFRIKLTSTAKNKKPAYRFSIPIEIGRKIESEIGELKEGLEVELQINAIFVNGKK